jgi:hypothetical protein
MSKIKSVTLIIIAFLISPAVPAAIQYVMILFMPKFDVIFMVKLIGSLSYIGAIFLGIPAYFILKRYRALNLKNILTAGTIIGVICYGVFFIPQAFISAQMDIYNGVLSLFSSLPWAAIGIVSGAAASFTFWAITKNIYTDG